MRQDQYKLMYELEDNHWWFLAKREFIKALLPRSFQNWQALDLGCGTGGTTKFLENWGKVTGVEASEEAIRYLKMRKINFLHKPIEALHLPENSFDLVCFFDVLYHRNIKNDIEALSFAFKILKPNGLLLITDCALPFLFSSHDRIMHARERYYLKDLVKKIKESGFAVEKNSYIYFFVFPLFLLFRFADKYFHFEKLKPMPSFINSLLLYLCQIEATLLKLFSFPMGSSIIIRARKPKK